MGFSVFTRDPDDMRFSRLTLSLKKFFSGMILVGDAADDHVVRTLNRDEYPLVLLEKNIKGAKAEYSMLRQACRCHNYDRTPGRTRVQKPSYSFR